MFKATLPEVYPWESQVIQYPYSGEPGITYVEGIIDPTYSVDCLLYRDEHGLLVGVLNHYPADFYPYERRGNVNIWVREDQQRKGIATALWREAEQHWPVVLEGQRFTKAGAALATHLQSAGTRWTPEDRTP